MRSLLYIVILSIITGCTYSSIQSKRIAEAEALMATNPDKALEILNALDVSEFKDSATVAEWSLLYSEALLANNLAAPTDTIINYACDYYSRHSNSPEFSRAKSVKTKLLATNSSNEDALATALYLQKEKEFYLYKERATRKQIILIALIFAIAAIAIILWQRQRLKLQRLQNSVLMSEASELKQQIALKDNDRSELKNRLSNLLDNRFSLIDSLCETYYETQGTKAEKKAIVEKVKSEIDAVHSDKTMFAEMESVVNSCRDNILSNIKNALPDMREEDYQLTVFIGCNLSTRTICLLLGESADVVYKRKSRLKARLKSINPDFEAIF